MTRTEPMRVLLANHWHDDNRGDSAITQGIITLVRNRWPNARITVTTLAEPGTLWDGCARHIHSTFPDVTVVASPAPTELRGWRGSRGRGRTLVDAGILGLRSAPSFAAIAMGRAVPAWRRVVAGHDLVILVGGSNAFDDGRVPAVLSIPRLAAVLGPAYTAVQMGVPVVVLGHTLGPFARPVARRLAARMLADVDLAVVREAASVQTARDLGVRRAEEAADMAFALTPRRTSRSDEMLAKLRSAPERTLVLSVRQHPTHIGSHDDRLVAEFAAAARRLIAEGVVDGVAVVAHTVGPTPVEDDLPVSRLLAEALQDVPVVLLSDDAGPAELSAFYGSVAAVVAVRLHAAILAINAGTPTFAVAYLTAKTHGVMAQVGLPDAVAEFRTVTAQQIVEGVRALLVDATVRDVLSATAGERRAALMNASHGWFDTVVAGTVVAGTVVAGTVVAGTVVADTDTLASTG